MNWEIVAAVDNTGTVLWVSRLAESVVAAAVEVVGTKAWARTSNPEALQLAIFRTWATGEPHRVDSVSEPFGRWHVQVHRVNDLLLCLCRELHDTPQLTPTELEVLDGMSRDLTSKQIASEIGTTEGAVNTHRASLRRKFGVSTNSGLVLKACRLGVI